MPMIKRGVARRLGLHSPAHLRPGMTARAWHLNPIEVRTYSNQPYPERLTEELRQAARTAASPYAG